MGARRYVESVANAFDRLGDALAGFGRTDRDAVSGSGGRFPGGGPDGSPFCPLYARGRVGPDWARRSGIERERVVGEVASFDEFAGEGFDPDEVHPDVRRFYERTAEYALTYETTWHPGFRLGALLASLATSRLEQLNLPGRSDAGWSGSRPRRLESRVARVAPAADPRGSRVWTRTDPETGEAIFVAIYATYEHDGVTYANVAVPLPWTNLSTVLRPETLPADGRRGDRRDAGVAFTTVPARRADRPDPGHAGLYLVTPLGAVALPMDQTFRVYPADVPGAPRSPVADATLVATHEMWVAGRQFLTIRYGIQRT